MVLACHAPRPAVHRPADPARSCTCFNLNHRLARNLPPLYSLPFQFPPPSNSPFPCCAPFRLLSLPFFLLLPSSSPPPTPHLFSFPSSPSPPSCLLAPDPCPPHTILGDAFENLVLAGRHSLFRAPGLCAGAVSEEEGVSERGERGEGGDGNERIS